MHQNTDGTTTYGSGYSSFTARLGEYKPFVEAALDSWDRQQFSRLLWEKDPGPWKQPSGTKEIVNRLGWLTVADTMLNRVEELTGFAQEIVGSGITSVVVLGMGGSSLSAEVFYKTLGTTDGFPKLFVLDSTVPQAVLDIERQLDLPNTLFIVSSKFGETIETMSAFKYFFDKLQSGRNFVAITDPGTSLQELAKEKGFRRVFINMPDIGGRYSALSYFGLVPAALIGVNVAGLLESARKMMEACGPEVPARNNPGVALGAIMAECAMRGRNKMTLLFAPEIASLGCWVEQLVAESTGKDGRGTLPIDGEPLGHEPDAYADDRLFVYTKLRGAPDRPLSDALTTPVVGDRPRRRESSGDQESAQDEFDTRLDALAIAGHPVVTIEIDDLLDLGQEYFRWEFATAVASALLAVNAFDQPNVASSKKITGDLLDAYRGKGKFPAQTKLAEDGPLTAYADDPTAEVLNTIRENGPYVETSVEAVIHAHLQRLEPGDYIALMAFTNRTPDTDIALQTIRANLADRFRAATTIGYGPRFLHSTGQFHKGGPNNGLFIQITAGEPADVEIPGEDFSFSVLKDAQAMGDFISLREKGCRAIRIHLGDDVNAGLKALMGVVLQMMGILQTEQVAHAIPDS